jgi:hypothetical protein
MTRGGSGSGSKPPSTATNEPAAPGEGIRSLKTSGVFRAVNFELYAKPVILIAHFETDYVYF